MYPTYCPIASVALRTISAAVEHLHGQPWFRPDLTKQGVFDLMVKSGVQGSFVLRQRTGTADMVVSTLQPVENTLGAANEELQIQHLPIVVGATSSQRTQPSTVARYSLTFQPSGYLNLTLYI